MLEARVLNDSGPNGVAHFTKIGEFIVPSKCLDCVLAFLAARWEAKVAVVHIRADK